MTLTLLAVTPRRIFVVLRGGGVDDGNGGGSEKNKNSARVGVVMVVVVVGSYASWGREKLWVGKRINLKGVGSHCDLTPFKFIRAWV